MESFKEYLNRNRGALLGCAVGVVCAVLFLTIGFFPTLLIAVMGGLGALIGFNKNIRRLFGGIFSAMFRRNNDDDDF